MKETAQRAQIVDVALAKFRRHGIRRVTLDEISRDLRISKKTLYQYFDNKEDIVRACTVNIASQVIPKVTAAFQIDGAVSEKLAAVWNAFSLVPRLITPELIADMQSDYPHIWEEIDARRRVAIAGFETLLEKGLASGEIRSEIHTKVAMRLIFAAVEKIMIPDVLALGEFTPQEAVDTLLTILIRGAFVSPQLKKSSKSKKGHS